jgi:hypothetical protein
MRKQAGIGALLLVCVGVVLGATVFRSDIAQATGLAQSITVNNTAANPVPVDVTNTSVPVHEQGTANVSVTNTSLSVHEQTKTELAAEAVVTSAAPLENVDVSGYKEIRIQTGNLSCLPTDTLIVRTDQGIIDQFEFCASHGASKTYDVPGLNLAVFCQCAGSAQVSVFGRSN